MILKFAPYVLFLEGLWEVYQLAIMLQTGFYPELGYVIFISPVVLFTVFFFLSGYGLLHMRRSSLVYLWVIVALPVIFPYFGISGRAQVFSVYSLLMLNILLAVYLSVRYWKEWKPS